MLLIGDIAAFVLSLWLTLLFRYAEAPVQDLFFQHLAPFSLLFIVWIVVFVISGLYDRQSIVFKSRLPGTLVQSQIVNMLIATAFFYFIPWYGISPKVFLFLYLLISLGVILFWRVYGYFLVSPRARERAVIVGTGSEMHELVREVRENREYNIDFTSVIDLDELDIDALDDSQTAKASLIVVDLYSDKVRRILPGLYNLLFSQIRFIGMDKIYENVFGRIPLSIIRHNWFLENVSTAPKFVYDTLKRIMDIAVSLVLGLISLVVYPFVAIAIWLDDGGPLFIVQDRVGQNGRVVRIVKFRSMARNVTDLSKGHENRVTRVGAFLRKSRIDELPQLWNVFRGDLSLIGPRPELPSGVKLYEAEIPYYAIRHLIKPGLSGWAQIYHENHPHHGEAVKETREKLSYDLYYIKNRSFLLDLTIALKTIKELVSRKGI